jgi:hypothetical protein
MKLLTLFLAIAATSQLSGQTVFEEDFESFPTGLDLSAEGYQLSQSTNYTGTVTAVVAASETNKYHYAIQHVSEHPWISRFIWHSYR